MPNSGTSVIHGKVIWHHALCFVSSPLSVAATGTQEKHLPIKKHILVLPRRSMSVQIHYAQIFLRVSLVVLRPLAPSRGISFNLPAQA